MKTMTHLLAVAALAVVTAAHADPQPRLIASDPLGGTDGVMSPDGRYIATSSRRSGQSKIWLFDRAGAGWRQLTAGTSEDVEPAFSPDGRRVVFAATQDEHRNLRIVDIASGETTQLTDDTLEAEYPAWSPDGRTIVFTGGVWKEQNFYVVAANGGKPRPVLPAPGHLGACQFLASNDRLICNTYDRAFGDVVEIDVPSGALRRVIEGGPWPYKPAATPDGRWIAYTEIGEDGDRIRFFPRAASAGPGMPTPSFKGRWPTFRRDGSELFFHRQVEQGTLLQVLDLRSRAIEKIPLDGVDPGRASLSRDGRFIAYCANPDQDPHIRIYDRTTRETKVLRLDAAACHPAWSPDGRRLAVTLRTGDRWEVAVGAADGSGMRVVSAGAPEIRQLNAPIAWSGDGARLTFAAATRPYESDLFVVDVAGATTRNVTADGWFDEGPSWTPDGREIVFMSTRGGNWSWGLFALAPESGDVREVESPGGIERRFPVIDSTGARWWIETDGCLGTTFVIRRRGENAPERFNDLAGARWFDVSADGQSVLVTLASRRTEYWTVAFEEPF